MKKFLIRLGILLGALATVVVILFMVYVYPFMSKMKKTTTINYDPKLTLVIGGGGNTGILVSDSAVLVIDTKMDAAAAALSKTVHDLAGNKRIIVVNTHVHTDHNGGNKYYQGQTIIAGGNYDKDFWEKEAGKDGEPTVWVKDSMVIPMGDDTATVINLPWSAHTQSDVFVYLHKRKMIFCGDVVLNKQAPAMFAKYNASGDGYIKAFNFIKGRFDIAKVVPGHGEVGGVGVIDTFADFFADMKLAALDPSRESDLVAKYKDWNQVPIVMSPAAAVSYFRKKK